MSEQPLRGKVALITGAGSGLGEATARAFARAGCAVACLDIRQEAAARVAGELEREGVRALALRCDVGDASSIFGAVEQAASQLGRVDFAVNNAAIDHTLSVEDMTVAQWDQVLSINLRGPFVMAKAVMPLMRQVGGGHIVNIASTAGVRAWANTSAYHASKWGVIGLGRAIGVEGRADNIRVTTIIPGGMRTHFFDRFADQGIPMPPQENLQDPANVAASIIFAVSMPGNSVVQELMVTPMTESSWP
ncbi:MAG: SDR family oxidoreductase [Roseiflexaceae bacterium]|nr:SDR family oxidoreductase [Roseiflexaceae bacterium]